MICKTCQQPVRVSAGPTSYGGWVHVNSRFDTHRIVLTGTPERLCCGCGETIEDGQVAMVTVTRAQHVITVPSHEHHREASRAAALEDMSWQRDQSHYGGEP